MEPDCTHGAVLGVSHNGGHNGGYNDGHNGSYNGEHNDGAHSSEHDDSSHSGERNVEHCDGSHSGEYDSGSYYGEHRRPLSRTQANAVTDIELTRELGGGLGLYTLYPHTGFTHQLRVAMNELGAPICGDPVYPQLLTLEQVAARQYPLQLLAAQLAFDDPVTGEHVRCESARRLALEG